MEAAQHAKIAMKKTQMAHVWKGVWRPVNNFTQSSTAGVVAVVEGRGVVYPSHEIEDVSLQTDAGSEIVANAVQMQMK